MKYSKILSFAFLNSVVLFAFASVLSSCQQDRIQKMGLFSKLAFSNTGRSIASADSLELKDFQQFQDPQQVLMFCKLNSKKVEPCYNLHMDSILEKYTKNHTGQDPIELSQIKKQVAYENIEKIFQASLEKINNETLENVKRITLNRKEFCEKNSKFYLEKCLTQYIEKDTFSILNQFHHKNKMNGQEYLIVKNSIRLNLENHLLKAKEQVLKQKQSI